MPKPRRGRSRGRDWQLRGRARTGSRDGEQARGGERSCPAVGEEFPVSPAAPGRSRESLARPARRHSARAPAGRAGLPRSSPRPPGPPRLAHRHPLRRHIWLHRCSARVRRARRGGAACALGPVYAERRGLPWAGGCLGACGRCTSSCGHASPARSRLTFPSRVSGPRPGLAPGSPGPRRAALDSRPGRRAEAGTWPRCPRPSTLRWDGYVFLSKDQESGLGGGAGRARPPLCGQEGRCVPGRPHPRKGKFEKLVIGGGRTRPGRPPSERRAHLVPGPGSPSAPKGQGPHPQLLPRATCPRTGFLAQSCCSKVSRRKAIAKGNLSRSTAGWRGCGREWGLSGGRRSIY